MDLFSLHSFRWSIFLTLVIPRIVLNLGGLLGMSGISEVRRFFLRKSHPRGILSCFYNVSHTIHLSHLLWWQYILFCPQDFVSRVIHFKISQIFPSNIYEIKQVFMWHISHFTWVRKSACHSNCCVPLIWLIYCCIYQWWLFQMCCSVVLKYNQVSNIVINVNSWCPRWRWLNSFVLTPE